MVPSRVNDKNHVGQINANEETRANLYTQSNILDLIMISENIQKLIKNKEIEITMEMI